MLSAVSPWPESELPEQQLEAAAAMQLVDEAAELVALADDLAQQIVQPALAGPLQNRREGAGKLALSCQPPRR